MVKLWEGESFINDNTLPVNIARLRKKLAKAELAATYWLIYRLASRVYYSIVK